MRLVNVDTFRLETFMGVEEDVPSYAILSHTWGSNEIVFEDMRDQLLDQMQSQLSFQKIAQSCHHARQDGLQYIWIDTCCIDKSSSAELSEAINSMFRYYQQSSVCYVHLEDFKSYQSTALSLYQSQHQHQTPASKIDKEFCSSRWFNRGWTLQELIAPRKVVFLDKTWTEFGTRDGQLLDPICNRTGIWPPVFTTRHCLCPSQSDSLLLLRNGKCTVCHGTDNLPTFLGSINASVIFSWAANRITTRREDMAYSLMGLFGVNLPLLYGEGGDKAFIRLQSAILKRSNDHSVLLWRSKSTRSDESPWLGCLAYSPAAFQLPVPIIAQRVYYDYHHEQIARLAVGITDDTEPMEVSDTILTTTVWLCPCNIGQRFGQRPRKKWMMGILNCGITSDYFSRPAILLSPMGSNLYRRIAHDAVFLVNPRSGSDEPISVTLSLHNQDKGTTSIDFDWASVENISIAEAVRTTIRLLIRPSGPSLSNQEFGGHDALLTSNDAVCCVVNKLKQSPFITTKVVGGYPAIYSADTTPSTMPMLRSLIGYDSPLLLSLIGGIHKIEIQANSSNNKCAVGIYAIWGLHRTAQQASQAAEPWQSWCRVFEVSNFSARHQLDSIFENFDDENGDKRLKYEKQLCAWLTRKSKEPDWLEQTPNGTKKRVLPNTLQSKWTADRILDLLPDSCHNVGLSCRVNITKGLGRRTYDLELTLLTPECNGWHSDTFDGSRRDQEKHLK